MGKIKKILENELVGGTQTTDVYPVTSIKAVYDENNERLDHILNRRGVVNVSTNYNEDHIAEVLTLTEALNKVPSSDRVLGFTMTFLSPEGWRTYKFVGSSVQYWTDLNNWSMAIESDNVANDLGEDEGIPISQDISTWLSHAGVIPHGNSAIVRGYNLLDNTTYSEGALEKSGSVQALNTFVYTDYINVSGIKVLLCNSIPQNGGCFYNASKEYISGFGYINPRTFASIIVPEDAVYIRYNVSKESRSAGTAFLIGYGSPNMNNIQVKFPWLLSYDDRIESMPLRMFSASYENGLLQQGKIVSFPNYYTYTFDVSKCAGKDIYFTATHISDPNIKWDLYNIIKEDGTSYYVENTIGNDVIDLKITLPSDAKYLKASSSGIVLLWDIERRNTINPNIFTAQEVAQEVAQIASKSLPQGKTAIISDEYNLLVGTTYTTGKYLNYTNGEEITFDMFSYSDYIDISGIPAIQVDACPNHGGCFYDEDKNHIGGFGISSNISAYGYYVKVPNGAKYLRYNVSNANLQEGTAYVIDYRRYPTEVSYPWLKTYVTRILPASGTARGYMANDGTINTQIPSGGTITKYDVSEIDSVLISLSVSLDIGASPKWCTIWVVDGSNDPILMLPVDTTGNTLSNYPVTIPEGGKQIWVQSSNPVVGIKSELNDILNDILNDLQGIDTNVINNQWTDKKIVWLGTSIPYGQGTDGTADSPTTYPMQVGKKLGATVVNVARPGMAIETTEDFKRKTYGSLSLTIAELESESAPTTPYQSYENAMLGQNADLYVFDCEPNNSNWDLTDLENFSVHSWKYNDNSTFESHRNSYVGALLFLLDKLWTEKPSAKVVLVSEFIAGSNLDSKYQGLEASKAVAEKLRIPLIDVASRLYYTPINKNLYLNSDNVHPKQATHDRIANMLASEFLDIN